MIDGDAQEVDTKEWLLTETRQLIVEVRKHRGREKGFVCIRVCETLGH
jgi:hypothetical protein